MSGFRGRGRGRGGTHTTTPKGLFANSSWHCDCNPRLPAIHFQVKKAGANKGRWFYTCQKHKDDSNRCSFFLWEDDAKPREELALLDNSRSEPGRTDESAPRQRALGTPPPPYTITQPSTTGNKRKRTVTFEDDEVEFEQNDEGFGDEVERAMRDVETPRPTKIARVPQAHTEPPQRTLPWQVGNAGKTPTRQTEDKAMFSPVRTMPGPSLLTPSKPPDGSGSSSTTLDLDVTPTPTRFKDATLSTAEADLVNDVTDLLQKRNVALSDQTQAALQQLLTTYSVRTKGIAKGRDLTRLALKAKEAKVIELQHRINTLEAELESERALVQHLRWKMENGIESDSS